MAKRTLVAGGWIVSLAATSTLLADPIILPAMSEATKECIKCHQAEDPGIYQQWGESRHFRANVGCYECHRAAKDEADAFEHFGQSIATIVSPKDCSQCHSREVAEFTASHHSKGARILGSLDNRLAEVVEGNSAFKTEGFPHGNSAAAVSGMAASGCRPKWLVSAKQTYMDIIRKAPWAKLMIFMTPNCRLRPSAIRP